MLWLARCKWRIFKNNWKDKAMLLSFGAQIVPPFSNAIALFYLRFLYIRVFPCKTMDVLLHWKSTSKWRKRVQNPAYKHEARNRILSRAMPPSQTRWQGLWSPLNLGVLMKVRVSIQASWSHTSRNHVILHLHCWWCFHIKINDKLC